MPLSVPELAKRLDVAESRARVLVASGRIPGQRVGGQWVVDEADAAAYRPAAAGRPLAERSAWQFIAAFCGEQAIRSQDLDPVERHRLSSRIAKFRSSDDPVLLACSMLSKRADELKLSASPADLADLKEDPRLRLSGVSHPAAGLLSGFEVEAYVARRDLDAVIKDFLLVPCARGSRANVVLHAADAVPDEVPPLLVAVDLAERNGVREQEAARELIRRVRGH